MGYRSDVSVMLYTCHKDAVPGIAVKVWFDENYPRRVAEDEWGAKISYGETYALVEYHDVKWYASYTHVQEVTQALERFVATFDEDDHGYAAWETVRIGEELADIERDASMYADWRLDVRREIVLN